MRLLILAPALLLANTASIACDHVGDQSGAASIPLNSASAEGFVPDGWYLEKSVEGDLDKDGLSDLVLIIRQNDPKLVIEGNGNPRTIVVALKQAGGGYLRIAQNDQIIPVAGGAMVDDPIDNASDSSLTIDKGVMRLNISFWASAGTWDTFNRTFSFRLKGVQLRLIGYDNHHVHRGSGALDIVIINYLTRRKKTETGSIEDDHVPEVWSRITRKPLILFDDIGDGYEFDPDKN